MKDWSYSLLDQNGSSYQVENGMVVAIGNYKPIEHTPIGWQDLSIGWERSTSKYGINRNFTLPLGFVIEGAAILSFLNWTNNFDQQVSLLINRKTLYIDTNKYYFYLKYFYKGELDFTTYEYDDDAQKVSIGIMEGGLSKLLKANENTVYEITPSPFRYIQADGINLHKGITYTIPAGIRVSNTILSEFAIPTATIGTDGFAAGVVAQDQIFEIVANHFDYLANSTNWLVGVNEFFTSPVSFRVHGTIKIICLKDVSTGSELQIDIFKDTYLPDGNGNGFLEGTGLVPPSPGFKASRLARIPLGAMTAGTSYSYDWDGTGTLQPNERMFFIGSLFTTVSSAIEIEIEFAEGTKFFVDFATQQATSYPKAMTLLDLYKAIGEKISGNPDDWESELLTAREDILVASGDMLRGFEDGLIKISMNQFFNSVNVILNTGLGVENNKVVLEEKAHFYQSDKPIPLGNVKQYKERWAVDHLYNTLKIGYANVNLENVNGRFAFNTAVTWTSPVKRITKELTLVSDIKADPFEIELVRINFDGQTTTDSTKDNDNYFIQTSTTPVPFTNGEAYPLLRTATVTGVPDPATIFNAGLSPRSLVEVHKNWLAGVFAGFETGELTFANIQYNKEVVVNGLAEKSAISISSLGAPLFKPVNFEFLTPFTGKEDQGMSIMTVYDEHTSDEWGVSGSAGVNFDDASNPYQGTKDILLPAAPILPVVATLQAPAPIELSLVNEITFKLFLNGIFPGPGGISLVLYNGATAVRTKQIHFVNNNGFVFSNTTSYQSISMLLADMNVFTTDTTFDRVQISVFGFSKPSLTIDLIQLHLLPQDDLVGIMEQNPNRCFSFVHPNGQLLKGHTMKVAVAPNTEEEQGFLLLATGDTDLTKLIIK